MGWPHGIGDIKGDSPLTSESPCTTFTRLVRNLGDSMGLIQPGETWQLLSFSLPLFHFQPSVWGGVLLYFILLKEASYSQSGFKKMKTKPYSSKLFELLPTVHCLHCLLNTYCGESESTGVFCPVPDLLPFPRCVIPSSFCMDKLPASHSVTSLPICHYNLQ